MTTGCGPAESENLACRRPAAMRAPFRYNRQVDPPRYDEPDAWLTLEREQIVSPLHTARGHPSASVRVSSASFARLARWRRASPSFPVLRASAPTGKDTEMKRTNIEFMIGWLDALRRDDIEIVALIGAERHAIMHARRRHPRGRGSPAVRRDGSTTSSQSRRAGYGGSTTTPIAPKHLRRRA